MSVSVAIQVPTVDSDDLDEIGKTLETDQEIITGLPFDGEAVAQLVASVTTVSLPFFAAWLRARVDARKHLSVTIKGMKLRGYSPKEVEKIIDVVQRELSDES